MEITIPPDLDILYVRTKDAKTTTVTLGGKEYGPVPANGAFAVLMPKLMREHPEVFPDKEHYETIMSLLHFQFLHAKQNRAGISYPFTGSGA